MKLTRLLTASICAGIFCCAYASNQNHTTDSIPALDGTQTITFTETVPFALPQGMTVVPSGEPIAISAVTFPDEVKNMYVPKVHGVIRTRWEGEFGEERFGQRFQVRNARVNVGGNVMRQLSYFIQADFSDRGKVLFLDAWGQWEFNSHWKIRAGQFRVPYGTDCFRAPGTYYFANRSFLAKNILNLRDVGVRVGYYGSGKLPLTVEAGVFNSADKSNHEVWQRQMNYAVKASYRIGDFTLSPSFISYQPHDVRINIAGGAVTWQSGRWIAEGEYANKHYTNSAHRAVDAWNLFASYTLPLKNVALDQLSFQGRFDGMTGHSTGTSDESGHLTTDNPARRRITAGVSAAHVAGTLKGLVRINYEKYFYNRGVAAPQGSDDKIVAELVIKF